MDALVIGGGHNGLVCACYLAAAGVRVHVLERRGVVGGAAVTEEFHPGFRNSSASYTVSLLNPTVIRDLRLHERGLRIVHRPFSNFLPLPNGDCFQLGSLEETREALARYSQRDARRLPDYYTMLDGVADLLRELVLQTPPRTGGGMRDLLRALRLGNHLRRRTSAQRRDLLDLFTKSAGQLLDHWFESEPIKAVLGFDSIVGNFASPYSPGSAYVLLHHVFGEVDGRRGVWGHAIGGMGAITQTITREAESRGVLISTDAPVARVRVQAGRAVGVTLENGTDIDARLVIANVDPKRLYESLIEPAHLEWEFLERIRAYRCASGSFRMNVALSELPDFRARPGTELQPHHQSGILIAPSLAYMERAYMDARVHGWAHCPVVEMLIPSTVDGSLAPDGAHVASLFCQHFNPRLPDAMTWDEVREEVADLIIDTVDAYAPNFKRSIIARSSLSPLDLERRFGLTGGDIFHGALTLDQLYSARPVLGYGDYRSPLRGLYLCGSGTHPGGGVTGAPGHNAAREILHDLRWRRA